MSRTRRTITKADMQTAAHHPWCMADGHADRCEQCSDLRERYPFKAGETTAEATARYFPRQQPIQPAEPEPELIMIDPGRPEMMRATEAMVEAVSAYRETLDELEIYMREQSVSIRRSRKSDEVERVETVRTSKMKTTRRRVGFVVLETDGHKREVRKVKTTASKLEKDGKLTRELAIYLGAFARSVADGMGAATEDNHDGTNRLTAAYEPIGTLAGFGSRTPSDRQLFGLEALQEMKNRVPNELMPIFNQIVDEETAGYSPLARTLSELGERLGYKHKQQTSAGGALVYAVTCLIAHYMREKGYNPGKSRQTVALES